MATIVTSVRVESDRYERLMDEVYRIEAEQGEDAATLHRHRTLLRWANEQTEYEQPRELPFECRSCGCLTRWGREKCDACGALVEQGREQQ